MQHGVDFTDKSKNESMFRIVRTMLKENNKMHLAPETDIVIQTTSGAGVAREKKKS